MAFAVYVVLFIGLFIAILNILPVAGPLNPVFATSLTMIIGFMKAWDFLLPIHELLYCFGIIIGAELGIYGWKVFKRTMGIVGSTRGG